MKTLLTALLLGCCCLGTFGQGIVQFRNYVTSTTPQINAPVYLDWVGGTLPDGSNPMWRTALIGGPTTSTPASLSTEGTLQMMFGTGANSTISWVNFRSGTTPPIAPGYVNCGSAWGRAVPGVDWGGTALVQMVAWEGNYTSWHDAFTAWMSGGWVRIGFSNPLTLSLPSGPTDVNATYLWGLNSFAIGGCLGPYFEYFTAMPTNQTVNPGEPAVFCAGALACPYPAFQWFFNGAPIPGAVHACYQIASAQASDAGEYYAILSGDGWGSRTTPTATLTVRPYSPTIISQPSEQKVVVGWPVDLHVGAGGAVPLGYQWFLDGKLLSGAAMPDLHYENVQLSQAGAYTVVVTNVYGSVTSAPAILTVIGEPPKLVLPPWDHSVVTGGFVDFTARATGALPQAYQWFFNGNSIPGATSTDLHFQRADSSHSGNYTVVVTNAFGAITSPPARLTLVMPSKPVTGSVVAWGDNRYDQGSVPAGVSNIIAVSAGDWHNLALDSAGGVHAWGYNSAGQTNIPPGLDSVTAISAGSYQNLALKSDGTVVSWGSTLGGTVPAGLSNVTAVAAGGAHNLALKSDGTVVAWGYNNWGQTVVPPDLVGVVAVAAGANHSLALRYDGTLVAWGYNGYRQTNVPSGLAPVTAIAAGGDLSLALTADGRVFGWGGNCFGQVQVPPEISSVIALAAGGDYFNTINSHCLALKSDGTTAAWGYLQVGPPPDGLETAIEISCGGYHNLALVSDAPVLVQLPVSQTAETGSDVRFSALAIGKTPLHYQWYVNSVEAAADATNCSLQLSAVQPASTGAYTVVVTNTSGSVTSPPVMLSVIARVERTTRPGLLITSQPGSTLNLEQTDALSLSANWAPLASISMSSASQWYFDGTGFTAGQRFYRAWQAGETNSAPGLAVHTVSAIPLQGIVGGSVRVDCIDQVGPTDAWLTLATVGITNASQEFFDTSAIGQPPRLYRLVPVP